MWGKQSGFDFNKTAGTRKFKLKLPKGKGRLDYQKEKRKKEKQRSARAKGFYSKVLRVWTVV